MDYGRILSKSIELAVKRPSLWIFGLFAGGGMNLNIDSDRHLKHLGFDTDSFGQFESFDTAPDFDPSLILSLAFAAFAMALVFFACWCIARPALIDAVNKLTRGGIYQFGDSFSRGIDFLGRFALIVIFYILIATASVTLIGFAIGFSFAITPVLGVLALLLLLPLGFLAWLVSYHVFSLAEVAMVARDISIGDALAEGWTLFRANIGKCALLTLIYIGIMIGVGLVVMVIALFTFVPINLLVASMTESLPLMLFLGVVIALPVSIILGGITGTFSLSLYTQFYFGLVDPQPQYTDLPPSPAPIA